MKLTAKEHPYYRVFDAADRQLLTVVEFDTETCEAKLYIPVRGEVPSCFIVGLCLAQDDMFDDTLLRPVIATCVIPGAYALDPEGNPVE